MNFLYFSQILSTDGEVRFWCVTASHVDVLYDVAEELNENLPTMKNDVYKNPFRRKGYWNRFKHWLNKVDPFKLGNEENYGYDTSERGHYFSSKFDKRRLSMFLNSEDPNKLFPQALRSKLVSHILEHTKYSSPETTFSKDTPNASKSKESSTSEQDYETYSSHHDNHMGISHLITKGIFTAAYPCHEEPLNERDDNPTPTNDRQFLCLHWASFKCMFRYQPIELIKKYFGIRIAFYFKWLGFYTACLVPASIVGVMVFIYGMFSMIDDDNINDVCSANSEQILMCPNCDKYCPYYSVTGDSFACIYAKVTHIFDNNATPFFAVFMSFWSIIYLELWKRKESLCIYDWHIQGYVDNEVVRPEFAMSARRTIRNPINGRIEPVSSRTIHAIKLAGTFSVATFFVFLVIASVLGVMVFRAAMYR